MANQLFKAETKIIFIPKDSTYFRGWKDVTLKDSLQTSLWSGKQKGLDIRVAHCPSNGFLNSAHTRITFDESIPWKCPEVMDGIEIDDTVHDSKTRIFISDDREISLTMPPQSHYSEMIVRRSSQVSYELFPKK